MKPDDHRRRLFAGLPSWLQEAYFNDPTVNRIVCESALVGSSYTVMLQNICAAFFEQRNCWKATAEHLKQYEPLRIKLPAAPAPKE